MLLKIKKIPHLLKYFKLVSLPCQNFLVIKHLHNELNSPGNVICRLLFQLFKISLRAKAIRSFINLIPFCSCTSWLGNKNYKIKRTKGQKNEDEIIQDTHKVPWPMTSPRMHSLWWYTTHSKWPFSCEDKHFSGDIYPKGKVGRGNAFQKRKRSSFTQSRMKLSPLLLKDQKLRTSWMY